MSFIYNAASENSLICFMDSRPWNAPLPVFCRLVNSNKIKSTIFFYRRITTALKNLYSDHLMVISHNIIFSIGITNNYTVHVDVKLCFI